MDLIAVSNIISTHRFGVCIDNVRMLILSNMTRCKREIRKLFDCEINWNIIIFYIFAH